MSVHSILIVDDHREVRRLIRLALEGRQNGYRILDVPSGEEALLINTRQQIDLLLADVRLAGMSGIELARKMRARSPKMRVILISGIPRDEIQADVDKLKADRFFPKPLDLSKLAEDIDRLLSEGTAPLAAGKPAALVESRSEANPGDPPAAAGAPERQKALDLLQQQFGAASLLLMSSQGQLIAQSGGRGNAGLPAAVQAQLDAFTRFASLLGADRSEDVVRLWGDTFFLCLVRRAERSLIGFFFDTGSDVQRLELSRRFSVAARDAWPALSQTGPLKPVPELAVAAQAPPLPAETPASVQKDKSHRAAPEPLDDAGPEETAEVIAALFSNGGDTGLDTGELNNFWETAAEDIDDVSANASAISYDQALNLGLAPDDGAP